MRLKVEKLTSKKNLIRAERNFLNQNDANYINNRKKELLNRRNKQNGL